MKRWVAFLVGLFWGTCGVWAEAWIPAAAAKQAEAAQDGAPGPLLIHNGTLFEPGTSEPAAAPLPVDTLTSYNQNYAWGRYDGQLWQGRGWNLAARGGVSFDSPWVFGQLAPEVGFSQNQEFAVGPDRTRGRIDLVQRFGDEPLSFLGWGQSFVGTRWGPWSLRLSTENLWVGPAYRNPIVWGTEAPGIAHMRLNLDRYETSWGAFEGMIMLGHLDASDQAASTEYRGKRGFWGLVAGYSPSFLPQLTLGASRTIISRWDELSLVDLARLALPTIPGDTDLTDQRINLMWRFRFPSLGFEVYGEWARNDFSPSLSYVLRNPFHSEAWTSGLVQRFEVSPGHALGIQVEWTNLTLPLEQLNNVWDYDAMNDFYTHWILKEGYTNGGQLLGAPIGNGGNSQSLTVVWYHPQGQFDLGFERWHKEASYFYSQQFRDDHPEAVWETDVDVELSVTAGWIWRERDWTFHGQLVWMLNLNRYYIPSNDVPQLHVEAGVRLLLP